MAWISSRFGIPNTRCRAGVSDQCFCFFLTSPSSSFPSLVVSVAKLFFEVAFPSRGYLWHPRFRDRVVPLIPVVESFLAPWIRPSTPHPLPGSAAKTTGSSYLPFSVSMTVPELIDGPDEDKGICKAAYTCLACFRRFRERQG